MAGKESSRSSSMRFSSVLQTDVPRGRNSKHKQIILQLLSDLQLLEPGKALKVPLSDLPDTKENIRSALNRATRQRGMNVETSSDVDHLYIWNTEETPR
jgi:hypothetical protein